MYKGEGLNVVGVLNDFDLASTEDGITGYERTGTIPFMALDLLTEDGLAGKIKHVYAHDVESFLWVLLWTCLRYHNGKLRESRAFDEWAKVDAHGCGKEKTHFLTNLPRLVVRQSHACNMLAAQCFLDAFKLWRPTRLYFTEKTAIDGTTEGPFEALLRDPLLHFTTTVPFQHLRFLQVSMYCMPTLLMVICSIRLTNGE